MLLFEKLMVCAFNCVYDEILYYYKLTKILSWLISTSNKILKI